jgi:type IV secretion system protein VirB9
MIAKIKTIAALTLLLAVTVGHAETRPLPGHIDPRVREVVYNEDDVIRLIGYEGYQTHLKLGEGEEFIGVGAGDTGGLDITAEGRDTWIKPKASLVRTNFDLKTNKRVYHFDYHAHRRLPKNPNTMVYSIKFRYPDEDVKQRTSLYLQDRLKRNLNTKAVGTNREYYYCGNYSMRPVETYDDGKQTHIKFRDNAEFPAIFVENEDETEALVNFHIDPYNGDVVVHRVAHRLVLRRGDLVGCIENRHFTGGGKRATSGTVSPDVVRETKQAVDGVTSDE